MELLGGLIGIIIWLIVIGFVWWAAQQLISLVPVGEPFGKLINIVVMLILLVVVIWAIVQILGVVGVHVATPFAIK